jgi:6-phosphogluconolactonase (cycloisomerase 2 family)
MKQATGYVYVQTNDANANEIVVYRRDDGGRLERLGSYLTGGRGSGEPHLQSQSSVVVTNGHVFVTNAGSDELTVFAVSGDELVLVDRVPSGGSAPKSVAVHEEHVYVLNTGGAPSLSGFRLENDGLVAINGGSLGLGEDTDPAQVAFGPSGRTLLVTDRARNAIHVVRLDDERRIVDASAHRSSGATPYGFDVRADGTVVVTEAAGAQVGQASASSYRLHRSAELEPVSGVVGNTRSEVCWAVISKDGRTVFVTNFADGTISSYAIGDDGSLTLREAVAATTVDGRAGIRDEALSGDGRFLYALHADTGNVFGWEVRGDGTLDALGSANGLPLTAAGLAAS